MNDQYCDAVIPGKAKVNKIFETATVLAYYARQPLWPAHAIVIPKQHITSILEFETLDADVLVDIMRNVAKVADHLTKIYGQCRVQTNAGSYQHTKHLHWHVYSEIAHRVDGNRKAAYSH